jgi:hypothetical protein
MRNRKVFTVIGFSNEVLCRHVVDVLNKLWVYEGVEISYNKQDDRRFMVTAQVGLKEKFKLREEDINVINAQATAAATSFSILAEAGKKV